MNCDEAIERIEASRDGPVEATALAAARAHVASCPDCRSRLADHRALRNALRRLPGPPDEAAGEARERVFGALRAEAGRRRNRQRGMLATAASVLLLGVIGWSGWSAWMTGQETPDVALAAEREGTVGLMLESGEALRGARITLEAPDEVAFRDYPDVKHLTFETDLDAGRNYLEIPVTARGEGDGCLKARIEHEARSAERCIRVQVAADQTRSNS